MNIDIAYIVSHGFAARMVMQTNLLGMLRMQGKKVALICPDAADVNLKSFCLQNDISLFEFNPSSSFWSGEYLNARKYFLEDIKKNPALWEKHLYATKYSKSKNIIRRIQPHLLFGAHQIKRYIPQLKKWYRNRETRHLKSRAAIELITRLEPALLVSTYPVNFTEAMLLKAAKESGYKTAIHLLSWDNISCKGHFPQLADEYIVWGDIMKNELKEYYAVSESRIHTCGVPHFDLHLTTRDKPSPDKYLKDLGLSESRPYLFFGMSSPRFAPKEIDIVEWLANKVENGGFGNEMQLVVRPHPQNVQGGMSDKSWLPRLKVLQALDMVAIDYPDLNQSKMPWSMQERDMVRLSHLLAGCSVSLNSGSTLSIDALMCNRPVILTSFDAEFDLDYWRSARRLIEYTHLKKLVDLGGVSVSRNFEELEVLINQYLFKEDHKWEERRRTVSMQCDNYESAATPRCKDILMEMCVWDAKEENMVHQI